MFSRQRSKASSTSRIALLETSLRRLSVNGVDAARSDEDVKGPMGLCLLFEPSEPLVDLIFVHGLRGGSRKTWSKTKDPYHYWPKEWLPRDPRFKNVRIHSFGYNADWGETKQSFLNIHDFGKSLLGAIYDSPHIRATGDTPLLLIGHSMGGLVSKKAYVLARQDPAYQDLARRFYGIIFLATPHRGSDSAQQLSNVLRASIPHGAKPYLVDLERGSGALQAINDDFRHYSDSLQLRSFYETLKTTIGMNSVLIVDKASATLDYPNEKSALINATHRSICKFETPSDPNFTIVRNALLACIDDITQRLMVAKHEEHRFQMRSLESYLGVSERPEDELTALEETRFGESGLWFTSKQSFQNWRDDYQDSARTFWLSGKPATGKSVLAGNVIGGLEDLNLDCSYYFFRYNDTAKNSLDSCLRSIPFQMAISNIKIRRKLLDMKGDDVHIDKTDERGIWRKLFVNGHGRLLEICLKYMSGEAMRPPRNYKLTKLAARSSKTSLLHDYACVAFNEHLRRVHSAENNYLILVDGFLTSNVLSWIDYLAKTGRLHHITWTAKDLRGFLEARAKYCPPVGREVQRVDNWATDLVRLVAKFGKHLLELPSAIYWLIPPFCPRDSAIGLQFAGPNRGIVVYGLANRGWDDRLACISYHELQASAVAYTDRGFVVALSDKTLRVYNKTTLQETKRLQHEETARILTLDGTGRNLACSGRKQVRVWNLITSDILFTFQVQHEPLALRFSEDDATLMAITRGNVTSSWNLSEGSIITPRIRQNSFEGEDPSFRRPLIVAAISLALSMSAVVYRSRPICLFDLDQDVLLGTCNKEQTSDSESRNLDENEVTSAIALVFNPKPDISLLAATYIDGDLALYDPCEFSLIAVIEAGAQALACSPDGRTLVTGDSIGNIQLFEFETLRLMYRIRADEYQIKCLTFSNDGLRFFDVRGPQCNVWEPSVLVRTEIGENDSVSDMIPSAPKSIDIVDQDNISEVTSMVCHPTQPFVFYGDDHGSIFAFDIATAKQTQILWKHAKGVPISALAWADDKHLLVSADASSRLRAYRLDRTPQRWDVKGPLLESHLEHSINSLVASTNKDVLLVSSQTPCERREAGHDHTTHTTTHSQQISLLDLDSLSTSSPAAALAKEHLLQLVPSINPLPPFVNYIIGHVGSKLAFLDHSFWVCSMHINNGSKQGYSRHFFIPDDWINASQQVLLQITSQGDCVLAREDALVVIKRGLRYEEFIPFG